MSARRVTPYALLAAIYAVFPIAVEWLVHDVPPELLPSLGLSIAWSIPVLLLAFLENPLSKVAALFWVGWFLVGSINVVASYYVYGKAFQMSVEQAGWIYLASTSAFLIGLLTAGRLPAFRSRASASARSLGIESDRFARPLIVLFVAFPILFAWSMHRALGYFPILQGSDITRQIYELEYGRLYGYAVLLVFSMLFVVDRLSQAQSVVQRAAYSCLLAAFLLISVLDGKRLTLMLFLASAAAYLLPLMRSRLRSIGPVAVAGALIAVAGTLYVGVFVVRKGLQVERYQLAAYQFSAVGDEYRDFVYSVNEYAPGEIPEYRWFRSAVFAGLNSTALTEDLPQSHREHREDKR